ncbi:hypothetical protein L0Y65_00900 [Candidatus Micrarchaeota archaeon]|nr:hypothetical protein [Candidatus Micrarchaeota archaeon]
MDLKENAGWLYEGRPCENLVSNIPVERIRGACAILMPVLGEKEELLEHLRLLEKQTSRDFTVIVISPVIAMEDLPGDCPFGLVLLREKSRLGQAAASYAGQGYALKKKFRTIIQADVGCRPISANLIERLEQSCLASPDALFLPREDCFASAMQVMDWYGAAHRSLFEKFGLTYLPFFFGFQEYELMSRMVRGGSKVVTLNDVQVRHRFAPAGWKGPGRLLYGLRNYAFLPITEPGFLGHAFFSMFPLTLADEPGRFRLRLKCLSLLFRRLLSLSLFRDRDMESAKLPEYPHMPMVRLSEGEKHARLVRTPSLRDGNIESLLPSLRASCRKEVEVQGTGFRLLAGLILELLGSAVHGYPLVLVVHSKFYSNPFALLPPACYFIDSNGELRVLSEGRPAILRFFLFAASLLAFQLAFLSYIAVSFLSWLRVGRHLYRYGLSGAGDAL